MTTFDTLLLLLIVSLLVIGVTVAMTLNRILRALCTVTNPAAAVFDRLRAQELQDAREAQAARAMLDDDMDADDVLDAALHRYRRALTHCHVCENAERETRERMKAHRRFDEGWREVTLACPKAGCGGHFVVSVHKDTRAVDRIVSHGGCEHTKEMAADPENFLSLSTLQLPS